MDYKRQTTITQGQPMKKTSALLTYWPVGSCDESVTKKEKDGKERKKPRYRNVARALGFPHQGFTKITEQFILSLRLNWS